MPWWQRSDVGAGRRQTNQPLYEDFQPKLERNEEADNLIITLHLPGFTKEQLRVTQMYDPRAIRIRGVRPILNNKQSRFDQEITVPTKCDLNTIHAKFQDDILTIKIPKHVPPKLLISDEVVETIPEITPSSTSKATADQQKAQKSKEEGTVQKAKTDPKSQKIEEKVSSKQETPSTSKPPDKPKPQKVQDSSVLPKPMPSTVGADKQKDEKSSVVSSIAHKPSADQPQMQKATQEEVRKPMAEPNFQKLDEKKLGEVKANEKEKAVETILQKEKGRENEKGKESSGSADHQKVLPKIKENKDINSKIRGGFIEEKPKEECDQTTKYMMGIKNVKETATEALNNVLKSVKDEEMQLLVNVGVAAVVLVGFGAYLSYNFGSSGQS